MYTNYIRKVGKFFVVSIVYSCKVCQLMIELRLYTFDDTG